MLGQIKDRVVKVVKKLSTDVVDVLKFITGMEMKESTRGLLLVGIGGAGLMISCTSILIGTNKYFKSREFEALNHAIELAKLKEKL